VKKTARKFRGFSAAEKADRDFYKERTGNASQRDNSRVG